MPDDNSLPDSLDSVLRKYGKIWIWSILSAAVAALSVRAVSNLGVMQTYALGNYGGRLQMGGSLFFYSVAVLVPSIGTLASVWYLLLFLRHHIVPILFPEWSSAEGASDVDTIPPAPPDGGRLLYRAFGAVVFAMASEVVIALMFMIYRAAA